MKRIPLPQIDQRLPKMRCDDGCGDCCGPIIVSQFEYVHVVSYAKTHGIEPKDNGILRCPWFQDGRCAVHAARPAVCRIFGHVEDMQCSRGYNTNTSSEVAEQVYGPYVRMTEKHSRFLHEVLGKTASDVLDEIRATLSL